MISTFNLTKLNHLLKDFYTITRIRITVFNDALRELAAYPASVSPLCRIIRTDPAALENCARCDRHACETAAARHTAYTYQCHAGLTESISPLYMGNLIIGYLLFGHVFSFPSREEGWRTIRKKCGNYKIDFQELEAAAAVYPVIPAEYITSASHILEAVASYLCLEQMTALKHKELPVRIDEYLSAHYTEEISAASICEQFGIGRTHLYDLSRQNYGVGIATQIRALRIGKAKKLLTESDLGISEISRECGFTDYNYFIAVFKKMTGLPPGQYRTQKKERKDTCDE